MYQWFYEPGDEQLCLVHVQIDSFDDNAIQGYLSRKLVVAQIFINVLRRALVRLFILFFSSFSE